MTADLRAPELPDDALAEPARVDGPDKVTGRALYAVEYNLPGAAYAWPVQSTIASGRVTSLDLTAARAVPGVIDVLTPDNAPRLVTDAEIPMAHSGAVPDLFILQDTRVVFRGQIVAAVVAESLESAREGAEAVGVAYEEGEPSLVLRADDPSATIPDVTNDLSPGEVQRGAPDEAFQGAAVQVDSRYETAAQFAQPMEPHAALAAWHGGRLDLYCSDQGPSWTAATFAGLFGLPIADVEVIAEHVGGGFGSKAAPRPPIMLAAMAARLVSRPVKVAFTRAQVAALTTYRSPSLQRVRLGADHEGRLTAVIHEVTAQSSRLLPYVDQTTSMSRHLYGAANVRTTAKVVQLDVPTPGWVRAPGEAPGMFALESAMDELADRLDMDPIELRVVNEPAVDPESGLPFSSRNLVTCLRTGAQIFGWSERSPVPSARRDGRWLYGMGVASAAYPVLVFPSSATIEAFPSGRYTVEIGAADIGTGARTVLHQLAAEALDVRMSAVTLHMGRASHGAAAFAGGSMGTGSWGWAINRAATELKRRLAAEPLPAEGLRVTGDTTDDAFIPTGRSRHSYGAHFAAVRVDRHTGEVRVDRLLGVFAAGRIINRATATSQAIGAMTMGLGFALMETGEPDLASGGWLTQDLASYHVPAHADVRDIAAVFLEESDSYVGPIGGKGVGEIGIVGVVAAITNAIYNASGVRVRTVPALPDRVTAALRGPAAAAAG
jgi:xanthine dehydrogenase YagR molybdenum-binding subunit